ncbi:endonuclease/exonuclease/phosphatase family protein [Streptomyces fractus]|uniref:endonuclease/exonuclease/phosphatase family protein n=1 Tax=Streptomyces fractus TaxID=641806 RepID=UPI003CE91B3D
MRAAGARGGGTAAPPHTRRRGLDPAVWRRGRATAVLALLIGALLAFHGLVPNWGVHLGSLIETFLPWLAVPLVPLLLNALRRRSATALIAVLVTALIWCGMFGPRMWAPAPTGASDLTVVSNNVEAANADPDVTAADLLATGADVIGLEELTSEAVPTYEKDLAGTFPYHDVEGTVGVWSKYPITSAEPVDLDIGWTRALRADIDSPQGAVTVYAAHMPSVRVTVTAGFDTDDRDHAITTLAAKIADDSASRVIVLGDFNTSTDDRALEPMTTTAGLTDVLQSGEGLGLTWPAGLPTVRPDQILVRGSTPVASSVLPADGSDHRPVEARLRI